MYVLARVRREAVKKEIVNLLAYLETRCTVLVTLTNSGRIALNASVVIIGFRD